MNDHATIEIAVFTSYPIGEEYVKKLHECLETGMRICFVASCHDSRNPYYSRENRDSLKDFCIENDIRFGVSPDEIINEKYTLGISFGNFFILRAEHLARFEKGIFNFHGARISKYRGSAAPVFHILEDDECIFGYTYHQINEKIDTGNILIEKTFRYPKNYTSRQINAEVVHRAVNELPEFVLQIRKFFNGEIALKDNIDAIVSRKRSELRGKEAVPFSIELPPIDRFLRAFDWPEIVEHPLIKINNQSIRLVPEETYDEMLAIYRKYKFK